MMFGATFPDTGYAVDHEYGELAHWSPFEEALIDSLRSNRNANALDVCFVYGVAAHGLQDEIFDTFFLEQAQFHDEVGQDVVDIGLDSIMVVDGIAVNKPPIVLPIDLLVEVFETDFGLSVPESTLRAGATRVKVAVIDHFMAIAQQQAEQHRGRLNWSAGHYLNPMILGSLGSEIEATKAYLRTLQDRLSNRAASSDIVSVFDGHHYQLPTGSGTLTFGLVLSRGVMVGSLRQGIIIRNRGEGLERRVMVTPGAWTRSDTSYTRVLKLELSETVELDSLEFRAPAEWSWIDSVPSSDSWYPLLPVTNDSDSTSSKGKSRAPAGCHLQTKSSPYSSWFQTALLILFSLKRRLKLKKGISS